MLLVVVQLAGTCIAHSGATLWRCTSVRALKDMQFALNGCELLAEEKLLLLL